MHDFGAGPGSPVPSPSQWREVPGGSPPYAPASWLAAVPQCGFLGSGQFATQARIVFGNTMKLDLKKLVIITTVIIIYRLKNLGRKEGRN